jgi:hypothetical protein
MTRLVGLRGFAALVLAVALVLAAGCKVENAPDSAKPADAKSPAGEKSTTPEKPAAPEKSAAPLAKDKNGWSLAYDGKSLANWKATDFGGQGKVEVKDGEIVLGIGAGDLTGITWAGPDLPKVDYEVVCEAKRVDGSDFFCGLTFPVKDSWASFICGGWGGTLCGISSLDGNDAANNETSKFFNFESNRWYHVCVRVTDEKIEAWIDGEQIVDVSTKDRKVGVRWEVEASQPLGVAAYRTKAAIRTIKFRRLSEQ